MAYNPKRQRLLTTPGYRAMMRDHDHPTTFYAARVRPMTHAKPDFTKHSPDGNAPFQEFKYANDGVGNILEVHSEAGNPQATVFAHYTYASGGQCVQKVVFKFSGKPVHPGCNGGFYEHVVFIRFVKQKWGYR